MKTHILCLGDSNTHGYCADLKDNADGGIRFNENERWTCRLQKALGEEYLVTEEGLSGRTTVFVDPIHESMDALSVAYPPAQEPRRSLICSSSCWAPTTSRSVSEPMPPVSAQAWSA